MRKIIASLSFCALSLSSFESIAAQSSIVMPTTNPHPGTGFTLQEFDQSYLNPALQSLLSNSSGATAPAIGPGAVPISWQWWFDTSVAGTGTWKVYDGASWVSVGSVNSTTHALSLASGVSLPSIANGTVLGNSSGGSAAPQALTTLPSGLTIPSPTISGAPTIPGLTGLSSNVAGLGRDGLNNSHWFIYNAPVSFDATETLRVDRHALPAGGTPGVTYKTIWAFSEAGQNNAGYEWTLLGQQDDYSLASTASQNVAVNGTITKKRLSSAAVATTGASGTGATATITFSGSTVIPVGHTVLIAGVTPTGYNGKQVVTASSAGSVSFASSSTGAQTVAGTILNISVSHAFGQNGVCLDTTGENNPVAGCIGTELDIYIQSPEVDATTDNNQQRVNLSIYGSSTAANTHIGQAAYIRTDANTTYDRIFRVGGNTPIVLDTTQIGTANAAAVVMKAGQRIVFDANSAAPTPAYNRYLYWQTGNLVYSTQNGSALVIDDTGNISNAGLTIRGATSGSVSLVAPAAAGVNTITLPAGTTDFSATGGTSKVVKQTTLGGAFTVGQLAASDLSNGVTGSGAVALATSPSFTTPAIGAATATSINKVALTAPATGATLTLADGSTLATSGAFSTTLTATAATVATLPAGTHTLSGLDVAETFSAVKTFSAPPKLPAYTVATLPTCTGAAGSMAYVTDATAPTYNGALTGGGAVIVPVFCNGTAWSSH